MCAECATTYRETCMDPWKCTVKGPEEVEALP